MENNKEKLDRLYKECIQELQLIGIDILNEKLIGKIDIKISKRKTKRYGCCKQEEPERKTRYLENGTIKYGKFNKHTIEISQWVMELNDEIIKNTIMHEIIHCMPYCNNHGNEFKKYAKYINQNLNYNITRVGNKVEDYKKSNIEYQEKENYKYKIECKTCEQIFFRQRLSKNFTRKYRCGKCKGKFAITKIY